MDLSNLAGFVDNSTLLIALGMLYYVYERTGVATPSLGRKLVTGVLLGSMGIAVMLTPIELSPGVLFSTRSIVLSLSGLFFGWVPATVSLVMVSTFRLIQGGGGAWPGVGGIITASAFGLIWRRLRNAERSLGLGELYLFGLVVQLAMVAWMFALPSEVASRALRTMALPIVLVYPVVTACLGYLMSYARARDIQDRKLWESEAHLAAALHSMQDGVVILDADKRLVMTNEAFATFSRLPKGQPAPSTLVELNQSVKACDEAGNLLPINRGPLSTALSGQESVAAEYHLRRMETGETWDGEYSFGPIRNPEGEIVGAVAVMRDVTERNAQELALRHSEQRFRDIFDKHSAAKLLIDAETDRIVDANAAAVAFYGWSHRELCEKVVSDINASDPQELAITLGEFEHGERSSAKTRHRMADGSVRDVEVFASTITIDGEPVTHVIVHDITKQRELEDQLRQAQRMESVGRLAGGVAHDFNNMLNVILGYAEMAQAEVSPNDALYDYLQEIIVAGNRSADITGQLLAFARKQAVKPQVIDLSDTIEEHLGMLRTLIGENVALLWRPGKGLCHAEIDPMQVSQILTNLCANSRDAIDGAGVIVISTGRQVFDEAYCAEHAGCEVGRFATISVTDDGCGMDEATMANIFEPFFTTKEQGKGTGLGLATVHGIAKQNGGFVQVSSVPGQGTTFTIYLPCCDDDATAVVGDREHMAAQSHGETILLVEDEGSIRTIATAMLERLGYHVLVAATPHDALRMANAFCNDIDLLLTDVVLPEMNGQELANCIQAVCSDVQVLFMSGYAADVVVNHGVIDRQVAFLQKPFSTQDLASGVKRALAKRHA